MSEILFTDVVPRDQLTRESGPSSSWAREMNHETRQFMAFQAIEEAMRIVVRLVFNLTGSGDGVRQSDINLLPWICQPLLNDIDRMYQYHQTGETTGENVCELPRINQKHAGTEWRGFRNFYLALRKEKQRLWTYFMTEESPSDIQANWEAAMYLWA